jgi:hypothetical protein
MYITRGGFANQVIMDGGFLYATLLELHHHRFDLILGEDQVAHHHRAAGVALEGCP